MTNVECNLCQSPRFDFLFSIPDLWFDRKSVTADFVRCRRCGLVFQHPLLDAQAYPDLYAQGYPPSPGLKDRLHSHGLLKRSRIILKYCSQGRLLDVGCGSGEFLRFFRERFHWQVAGIEPDSAMADHLRNELGLDVFAESLEQAVLEEDSFDVVTMWDVLEHLPDPTAGMRIVHRILRPEGIVVLRLPNLDSWDAKWFGKYWAGYDAPRHFYVFGRNQIRALLDKTGFEILGMQTNIGNTLNFIKSVQFFLTGKGVNSGMAKLIIRTLKWLPVRALLTIFLAIRDIGLRGSEMVIVARPR